MQKSPTYLEFLIHFLIGLQDFKFQYVFGATLLL